MYLRRRASIEKLRYDIDQKTGCWIWKGSTINSGYALIMVSGKRMLAHRLSYQLHKGPIHSRLEVDHLCRRRNCINPEHLELVTRSENVKRGHGRNGRIHTHCIHGHKFTGRNKNGHRICRPCARARYKIHYWKQKGVVLNFEDVIKEYENL